VIPENLSAFTSGSAGTARIGFVTVPAFCWVHRASQIRDFLLLYRDLATTERNTWAEAHLDGLIEKLRFLEQRSKVAWECEQRSPENYAGCMMFPDTPRPLP